MNYDSPAEIRATLGRLGLRLQKRWGQHFLINRGARQRIAELIDPGPEDVLWEIGPGLGSLTVLLLPRVRQLIAFEIDHGLVRFLEDHFREAGNFRLVAGDVLKTWRRERQLGGFPTGIIGNLPYNTASALIGDLAAEAVQPRRMVFTVQRELAGRMTAAAGSKSYSSFSVLCQLAYRIRECLELKPGSFLPPPEVASTVIELTPAPASGQSPEERRFALTLIRELFVSRRKTLWNNLLAAGKLSRLDRQLLRQAVLEAGIEPGIRAERLSLPEILGLSGKLFRLSKDLQVL